MRRRLIKTSSRDDVGASTDAFLSSGRGTTRPRRKSEGIPASKLDRASDALDGFMRSGDWTDARPLHFVALYSLLHERVYGVTPVMSSADRKLAAMLAGKCLREWFRSDPGALAAFLLWTWRREEGSVKWRKEKGRQSTFRVSWRYQFAGGNLVTDYRVATVEEASKDE